MDMYHWTSHEAAMVIVADGFRDGAGTYLTLKEHSGVWLTDTENDPNQGILGDTMLKVALTLTEDDIAVYEWVEDRKGYREWLIPADVVNRHATAVEIADRVIEPDWA